MSLKSLLEKAMEFPLRGFNKEPAYTETVHLVSGDFDPTMQYGSNTFGFTVHFISFNSDTDEYSAFQANDRYILARFPGSVRELRVYEGQTVNYSRGAEFVYLRAQETGAVECDVILTWHTDPLMNASSGRAKDRFQLIATGATGSANEGALGASLNVAGRPGSYLYSGVVAAGAIAGYDFVATGALTPGDYEAQFFVRAVQSTEQFRMGLRAVGGGTTYLFATAGLGGSVYVASAPGVFFHRFTVAAGQELAVTNALAGVTTGNYEVSLWYRRVA